MCVGSYNPLYSNLKQQQFIKTNFDFDNLMDTCLIHLFVWFCSDYFVISALKRMAFAIIFNESPFLLYNC